MSRRRRRIGLALAAAAVGVAGAALMWPDALTRVTHPGRYAVSGAGLLPPDRYADATQARASAGERVAALVYPDRGGPVRVTLTSGAAEAAGRIVYLDPPTARVLDVAAGEARDEAAEDAAPPAAVTRLGVGVAIDRARALTGGTVRRVTWPTERMPDWRVELAAAGREVTVAVADDGVVAAVVAPGD